MVIWLLGLSGSGKTTLGRKLQSYLEDISIPNYMIEAEDARSFFGNDLGYALKDRKTSLKRILYGAHVLSKAGMFTIVCCIGPFEDVRKFAREKLLDYKEVYLKCGIDECIRRDPNGVYKKNVGKTDIIGLEIEFDAPKTPDLILDTKIESEKESFEKLLEFFHGIDRPLVKKNVSMMKSPNII